MGGYAWGTRRNSSRNAVLFRKSLLRRCENAIFVEMRQKRKPKIGASHDHKQLLGARKRDDFLRWDTGTHIFGESTFRLGESGGLGRRSILRPRTPTAGIFLTFYLEKTTISKKIKKKNPAKGDSSGSDEKMTKFIENNVFARCFSRI